MKSSETKSELKRHLSFRDVYFLSFGGQSPLLSLLTYGAVAVSLGGLFSPVIMILAALLVLINGFVVLRLSKRFTTTGGYYSYAVQTLSDRVGFETGWMYIFYSLLFGLAYLIGAVFVINYILGLPIFLILFAMLAPAILFLVIGIQPSAR
ncbi:MAG: amino acid permease, partial [Candidatus Thermoplasmatota archaeon]|nr:amino acid permease [Candidatus Thermoplasmatota archaeon]